jgi:hypothetical protein
MWRGCPHDRGFDDDAMPGGPPSRYHVHRSDDGTFMQLGKYHSDAILFYTIEDREAAIDVLKAAGFVCIDGEEVPRG